MLIYEKRRDYFIHCLKKAFKENILIHGDTTGLHFIAEFNNCIFDDTSIANYDKHGLGIHPTWKHSVYDNYPKNTLIIGYSHLTEEHIEKAISLLASYMSHASSTA